MITCDELKKMYPILAEKYLTVDVGYIRKYVDMLAKCVEDVQRVIGETINLDLIPLDDKALLHKICSGEENDTLWPYFQHEKRCRDILCPAAPPIRDRSLLQIGLCEDMYNLDSYVDFEENPRKWGIDRLDEILAETNGYPMFLEDVLQIGTEIGNLSAERAYQWQSMRWDNEKEHKMAAMYEWLFVQGAIQNGYDEKLVSRFLNAFHKRPKGLLTKYHTVKYAIIAYQITYLQEYFLKNSVQ